MIARLLGIALLLGMSPTTSQGSAPSVEDLVHSLGELPAALPGIAPSDGVIPAVEQRRRDIYDQLWGLGGGAVPALCRSLSDPDVQVRRNVALFLALAGDGWYLKERPRLTLDACVPSLARALADPDERFRGLAAQALGATRAAGASAVPALIQLLESPSEGDRNSACIGLAGIGSPAKAALPALTRALEDPSANVRGFAKRAISLIER